MEELGTLLDRHIQTLMGVSENVADLWAVPTIFAGIEPDSKKKEKGDVSLSSFRRPHRESELLPAQLERRLPRGPRPRSGKLVSSPPHFLSSISSSDSQLDSLAIAIRLHK